MFFKNNWQIYALFYNLFLLLRNARLNKIVINLINEARYHTIKII